MITPYYKIACVFLAVAMLFGVASMSVSALSVDSEIDDTTTDTTVTEEPTLPADPDESETDTTVSPIPVPEPEEQEETTNPLNIIAHTLALKENTYVKYAVPAGESTVKMLFWTEAQDDYSYGTQTCEAEAAYAYTVNGVLCNIFQFTAFADKQMTDVLYARAYTEEDGEYTYGDVDKYSILDYAYNMRQDENADEELDSTLTALLDKGAAAQKAENYKTDDLANEPHSKIHTVDSVLADGFRDMLHPDSKEITEAETYLLFSGNITLYFENSVAMTGYQTVESYIYYFEDVLGAKKSVEFDGHIFDRHGRICGDCEFVTLPDGCTYYIVAQVIVYNYYIINNQIYYFGNDGVMSTDREVDGHYFNENGILTETSVFVDCGDKVYYVVDSLIVYVYIYIENELYMQIGELLYPTTDYSSSIFESDNDEDASNNAALGNVTCKAQINIDGMEIPFTVASKADGSFSFAHLPMLTIVFTFVLENYIDVTFTADISRPQETNNNVILDKNVSNTLNGRVTIADDDTNSANNAPLGGATVTIDRVSSTNAFHAETTTDTNGNYTFGELTAGVYQLVVVIENYIVVNQTVYIRYNETNIQNTPIEAIPGNDLTSVGTAAGNIKDARTGLVVVGVTIYIRAGLNNTKGEVLKTVKTDANGNYSISDLAPGNYTAQVVDERELENEDYRFGSLTIAVKVLPNKTITNQNATVSNSVGLDVSGMRVVLTWGATPRDLDSHMRIDLSNGSSAHIDFSNKEQLNAKLDVDQRSAYGPETITVASVEDNPGTYTYYVYNWSGGGNSVLSNSGAKINIYFGGSEVPAYTLYVPNGSGLYWNVFTYNSVTGEFTIVNTITSSPVIPNT